MKTEKKKFKKQDYRDVTDFTKYEPLSVKEAIWAKCMDCCCYQFSEVKLCNVTTCPLHQFKERGFKTTQRTMSEEHKEKMREHMKTVRNKALNNN